MWTVRPDWTVHVWTTRTECVGEDCEEGSEVHRERSRSMLSPARLSRRDLTCLSRSASTATAVHELLFLRWHSGKSAEDQVRSHAACPVMAGGGQSRSGDSHGGGPVSRGSVPGGCARFSLSHVARLNVSHVRSAGSQAASDTSPARLTATSATIVRTAAAAKTPSLDCSVSTACHHPPQSIV